MRIISTDKAPAPGGHYSQAVEHDGIVYVAGLLPVHGDSGEQCHGTIAEQTEVVLANLAEILKAANSRLDLVIKTTAYVSDISLWGGVNDVYKSVFGSHRPARIVVPTRGLHHGFLIEIEAVAAVAE